jgi:hypothetical protein
MAQADLVFGEGFDRCGRKLGQAEAGRHVPGALAAFGRDEFDGILRLLKRQQAGEAVCLVQRMHVRRWRFSTSCASNTCASVISRMQTGTVSFSAIAAPRNRRSPKTISKLRSARGRTNKGDSTPCSRMLAASSSIASSSNTLARVGGGFDQPIERQVAVLGLRLNCVVVMGILLIRLSRVKT